ncbi:hypothetical protein, partial [Pararhodobacter sp. SW119]|uniref:hypothetical protein n=1 Tax=Pararhodobacter sp. SW119 TaxID=2780075 RepID=UPI001ADF387E
MGFDAELCAGFGEGYFDLPAADEAMMSAGARAVSVLKKACGCRLPSGSLASTQRIGLGGVPGRYQSAMSEVISSV